MSRPLRIEDPGTWYNVMNRGRLGEDIFAERNDYRLFIEVLQESDEHSLFSVPLPMARATRHKTIIKPNPHLKEPVASLAKPKERVKSTAPRLARKLTNPMRVAMDSGFTALDAR